MSARALRALVLGWSSVLHGEATAGDVLSMRAVAEALRAGGVLVDTAWSAVMVPAGGLALADADPGEYTHVVWACGPLHGEPVREVLARFAAATTIAVGVSVLDARDPAVRGFDLVLPRDAPGATAQIDLAAHAVAGAHAAHAAASGGAERPAVTARPGPSAGPAVVGVYLTAGQGEYGQRRRHERVGAVLEEWLLSVGAARLALDTRLDPRRWSHPAGPEEVTAVISRLDAVVTMRLHGLVLALACGVPALAVDPVAGGGKVSAQARAWGWRSVVRAEEVSAAALESELAWCLSGEGRAAAVTAASVVRGGASAQLEQLVAAVVHGTAARTPSHLRSSQLLGVSQRG